MNQPIVIIGIGELGGVFARAFLRQGHPVYPVTRGMNMTPLAETVADPFLVLVAVAEKDLPDVLKALPVQWRNKTGLLQNELLPGHWERHHITNPTVLSVWFEKKKGQKVNVLLPTRVQGPRSEFIADSLGQLGIPCKRLSDTDELLFELVLKNVFVFTINIAGLVTGGTIDVLWSQHNAFTRQIAHEVIDVQESLTGATFPRDRLIDGIPAGVNGDPNHKCRGRAAPGRLMRIIEQADKANLMIPEIRKIEANWKQASQEKTDE